MVEVCITLHLIQVNIPFLSLMLLALYSRLDATQQL